jgi:4-diphosphocytidyl-2-C-methyl-D-erythritol kinase
MRALRALAPAKINLGLWLGPTRANDGKHELVTVMQSISLADEVVLEAGDEGAREDEVLCPGVPGAGHANLAAAALRSFRAASGWDAGPLRLRIEKRIPVAAGLGGGSADAAAALRLAHAASGAGDQALLRELAASLGADVPAQVAPGRWLATGAGERLEPLPDPDPPLELIVLPLAAELATAAVYARAERIGAAREPALLADRARELRSSLGAAQPLPAQAQLLANDLQAPASSLCPLIEPALARLRDAGAEHALVSGSGPTVLALFRSSEARERAAAALAGASPAAIAAHSVAAHFARVAPL